MWSNTNPFLNGPFEPLIEEIDVPQPRVIGQIPAELDGALYRTGNSQRFKPFNPDRAHWFDGDGMTHAFFLKDGKANYRCKWVQTEGLKAEIEAGRTLYNGLYGVSLAKQPELPAGAPPIKVVAGINIIAIDGKVLAVHENSSYYWELDPVTLETIGTFSFGGRFGSKMLIAHPHTDHQTNETFFVAIDVASRELTCFSADKRGKVVSEHTVIMDAPSWIHDFMFSKDWLIFFLSPILSEFHNYRAVEEGKGALSMDKELGTRLLLINRHDGSSRTMKIDQDFMVTHFMNAWQEGDVIFVDAGLSNILKHDFPYEVGEVFPFPMAHVSEPVFGFPMLHRIRIDVVGNRCQITPINNVLGEFYRPNEQLSGQPYRFGYLAAFDAERGGEGFNALAKIDLKTQEIQYQYLSQDYNSIPGEPIFVPKAAPLGEDSGWILSLWWDPVRNASELVIFDAEQFTAEPVARIQLDHRIPLSFHGNWIASSELKPE